METLQYIVTETGELGPRLQAAAPAPRPAAAGPVQPGAALAALLAGEDEEDWGDDTPDVSGDFALLRDPAALAAAEQAPPAAVFGVLPDGTLALTRWPRLRRPARVPAVLEGRPVTAIAAAAFAASHLDEALFAGMAQSPVSFSVFCMRMGRRVETDPRDEGGPTEITLPDSIRHIGPYAFWKCRHLTAIALPEGVEALPIGAFGDCSRLAEVRLPQSLGRIGAVFRPTDQVMPDVGAFSGCHALTRLTLPAGVTLLGAHTFNSAGLVHLTALDAGGAEWSRTVQVDATAFDHTAALLWLDKAAPDGRVLARLGLPAARDKIPAGDPRFGGIQRLPADFFARPAGDFDRLARQAFRLDFSARMALARLPHSAGLSPEDRAWYRALLVRYFDRAPQFMPGPREQAHAALFAVLQNEPGLTAADMSELLRTAGRLGLPADLIAGMMEVRARRFDTVTGFEDLALD